MLKVWLCHENNLSTRTTKKKKSSAAFTGTFSVEKLLALGRKIVFIHSAWKQKQHEHSQKQRHKQEWLKYLNFCLPLWCLAAGLLFRATEERSGSEKKKRSWSLNTPGHRVACQPWTWCPRPLQRCQNKRSWDHSCRKKGNLLSSTERVWGGSLEFTEASQVSTTVVLVWHKILY